MTKIPLQISPSEQENVKTVIIIQPFVVLPASLQHQKLYGLYCEYHRWNEPCTLLTV